MVAKEIYASSIIQVVIALSVHRRVEGLLQEHLDRFQQISDKRSDGSLECRDPEVDRNINLDENSDSMLDDSVMEKVLQRRSLRLRNMQRTWQV